MLGRRWIAILPCLMLIIPYFAMAQSRGTPEEAKALAIRAAEFLKTNDEKAAFAAFNAKEQGFGDRDLYVFVDTREGVVRANGALPSLVGQTILDLKDVDGKAFVREVVSLKSEGWVEYKWRNSVTKVIEPRVAYCVPVGDVVVGVSAAK